MALAHVGRPTESWPGPTRREDGEPVQILRGDATAMIPTIRRHRVRLTATGLAHGKWRDRCGWVVSAEERNND